MIYKTLLMTTDILIPDTIGCPPQWYTSEYWKGIDLSELLVGSKEKPETFFDVLLKGAGKNKKTPPH
jgi:hypothetical protein